MAKSLFSGSIAMDRTQPRCDDKTVLSFQGACHVGVGMCVLDDVSSRWTKIPPCGVGVRLLLLLFLDEGSADTSTNCLVAVLVVGPSLVVVSCTTVNACVLGDIAVVCLSRAAGALFVRCRRRRVKDAA